MGVRWLCFMITVLMQGISRICGEELLYDREIHHNITLNTTIEGDQAIQKIDYKIIGKV